MKKTTRSGMIIVASDKQNQLRVFSEYLGKKLYRKVEYTSTYKGTLDLIKRRRQDLLVIIDTAVSEFASLPLIKNIITINALVDIVVLSNMSEGNFNNEFEGLGILMQLSSQPSQSELKLLCQKIKTVK